jgi:hypothetical protein
MQKGLISQNTVEVLMKLLAKTKTTGCEMILIVLMDFEGFQLEPWSRKIRITLQFLYRLTSKTTDRLSIQTMEAGTWLRVSL